jgi:hypothetical protein
VPFEAFEAFDSFEPLPETFESLLLEALLLLEAFSSINGSLDKELCGSGHWR